MEFKINKKIVELDIGLRLSYEEFEALNKALAGVGYVECRQHSHIETKLLEDFGKVMKEII